MRTIFTLVSAYWVLLAIDMVRRTTYYLDPLEGSPDEELMQIVNQLSLLFVSLIMLFYFMFYANYLLTLAMSLNCRGIRIHQSLNSDTKANVQWIHVKVKIRQT